MRKAANKQNMALACARLAALAQCGGENGGNHQRIVAAARVA
jgi:hypothetical protein